MLSSQAYPHTDFKLQLHSQHNSYLKDRPDHAASALKRDRLKTYNEELSTYTNNSALFPPSGMTHKRYLANIEGKLLSSKPKHSDFSLNHSSTLYPYSFTEY
jgi:beta-glucanase (GH16 family)